MKRTLLLAALFATSSISFAQWKNNGGPNNNGQYGYYNNSALVLSAATSEMFTVSVDNGRLYQSNGSRVSIPSMPVGNHTVTVYEYRRNIFGTPRQRVLYSATVYFKPGIEHNMYINQYGQASFDERALYQNGNNGGYGNNGNGRGWGYGRMKDKHHKHKDRDCDDDRDDDRRGRW
ncbi:MAG: hypothetical protein U0V75_15595 [Ferruginibacter sp.]